jgi:hypothetical protein
MPIDLTSFAGLIVGLAGLLVLVAYDRWEHRRRQERARASGTLRAIAAHRIA